MALVTGANSAGKETARELARMGAHVVLACRSIERGKAARQDIADRTARNRPRSSVSPCHRPAIAQPP